jgi:uncharacterized membrane protein YhhN
MLVFAEHKHARTVGIFAKLVASSAFVALSIALGALHTHYGQLLLAALSLCWVGDVLLLGAGRLFLAGIASFLLGHIAFGAAFATRPLSVSRLVMGGVLMTIVASSVARWLWPHLSNFYRIAVSAYIVAIGVMVTLAFGASASMTIALSIGALAFAASDISVARDRFVKPGFINKLWGLPLYYIAQLLIISSLTGSQ